MESARGIEAITARMLTTLERKVDPAHTALIVVDVQNDFCAKGGGFDIEKNNIGLMQAMVPRLVKFIEKARCAGLTIVYTRSVHDSPLGHYMSDSFLAQKSGRARGRYTAYPFCKDGTWGADFYDGIKPEPGELVVNKHRFSVFWDTDLDLILRNRGIRTLIITGVTSNSCVETTARDGFNKDYYVVLLKDCAAAISEELHNNTVRTVDVYLGQSADSTEVLKCWQNTGKLRATADKK